MGRSSGLGQQRILDRTRHVRTELNALCQSAPRIALNYLLRRRRRKDRAKWLPQHVVWPRAMCQRTPEEISARFNRLIRELLHGRTSLETFQPWEVDLLLDMQNCRIQESTREGTLRRYREAVQRQIRRGGTVPMKLCPSSLRPGGSACSEVAVAAPDV